MTSTLGTLQILAKIHINRQSRDYWHSKWTFSQDSIHYARAKFYANAIEALYTQLGGQS